jgi:hypothetical protein
MGVRLSGLGGAVIVALSIAVAAVAVTDAGASTSQSRQFGPVASPLGRRRAVNYHSRQSGCDRPFTSTLFETSKVRVYAIPEESPSHPEQREPTIAGRPVFGCLKTAGRSRLLDLPEVGGGKHAYWVGVDEGVFAVRAPLMAYAYTQYYLDTHETWIRLRNLRTGKVVRSCLVGGAIAPRPGPQVTDIVLDPDGTVGWNAQGEGASESPVPGCDPTA